MTQLDRARRMTMGSDYIVRSLTITDERSNSDLLVQAEVIVDQFVDLPDIHDPLKTELFKMFGPHTSPVYYKRTSWKIPSGKALQEGTELVVVLDYELRSFLMNRFNAELYDSTEVPFPQATLVRPWWRRLLGK